MDYGPATYGDRWADVYDQRIGAFPGEVDFLAARADGGSALELGVGTGRVAIPLAERDVDVVGIDASTRMLDVLRSKSDRVTALVGDMADVDAPGKFDLVYVVFNTFFALLSQEAQVRCFANVAPRLKPNGVFVIAVFVPDPSRFDMDRRVEATRVATDDAEISISSHDPVGQVVTTQHIHFSDTVELRPVRIRYAWPSELDLMAQLAGLRLRERHEDFEGRSFTATSKSHVSVYGRG